jgi:hypothetical protein
MTVENRERVRAAGLHCCCSCFGETNFRGMDPFQMRRTPVSLWFESLYHFGCEVALHRA